MKPTFFDVWTHRLDPMRAEVRLRLHAFQPGSDLRGRLMGPRCRFTTTIEIAYPFRPCGSPGEYAAIVPEPSFWEPAKPFIYEGPVERIDSGGQSEAGWLRLCFRSLHLGPAGLILNGKAVTLKGKELSAMLSENELLELRSLGFNALLIDADQADVGDAALSLGFLLILREGPGKNGPESFYCQLDAPAESGRLGLPGITRQADGCFTV